MARCCRLIKAHHHEVQVGRERVHRDDLALLRADDLRHRGGKELVIGHPREIAVEMPLHPEPRPLIELFGHVLCRELRLQPERVAAKIDLIHTVRLFRNGERTAESG